MNPKKLKKNCWNTHTRILFILMNSLQKITILVIFELIILSVLTFGIYTFINNAILYDNIIYRLYFVQLCLMAIHLIKLPLTLYMYFNFKKRWVIYIFPIVQIFDSMLYFSLVISNFIWYDGTINNFMKDNNNYAYYCIVIIILGHLIVLPLYLGLLFIITSSCWLPYIIKSRKSESNNIIAENTNHKIKENIKVIVVP